MTDDSSFLASFSHRQRSVITTAITLVCLLFIVGVVVYSSILLVRFFTFFADVFLPLAVAGILALMLKPYFNWLFRLIRIRWLCVALVFISLLIPIGLFGWFLGGIVKEQVAGMIRSIPGLMTVLVDMIRTHFPGVMDLWNQYQMTERVRDLLTARGGDIANSAAAISAQMISAGAEMFRSIAGLLGWAVLPVYLTFLLFIPTLSRDRFETMLPFLKPDTRKDVLYLGSEFVGIMVAFFRGQVVIALIQGVLYAIGFAIVGVQYGIVLGLMFGILNIIPYLGNILGLVCVLPIAYLQEGGGVPLIAQAGVVFVAVQCIEGYFLTPKIMGDQTGLHPMMIIFAMFFWGTALGGIMGMILAIPLTAFLVVFWRLLNEKYIKEWL